MKRFIWVIKLIDVHKIVLIIAVESLIQYHCRSLQEPCEEGLNVYHFKWYS